MASGATLGERRGGRRRGTPNKRSIEAQHALKRLKFDPLRKAVALYDDPVTPVEQRVKIALELLQYCYPRRKAVDHSSAVAVDCGIVEIPARIAEGDWPFPLPNGQEGSLSDSAGK